MHVSRLSNTAHLLKASRVAFFDCSKCFRFRRNEKSTGSLLAQMGNCSVFATSNTGCITGNFRVRQKTRNKQKRNSRTSSVVTVAGSELEARTTSTRTSHWIWISMIALMQSPSILIMLSFALNCEHSRSCAHDPRFYCCCLLSHFYRSHLIIRNLLAKQSTGHAFPHHIRFLFMMRLPCLSEFHKYTNSNGKVCTVNSCVEDAATESQV